MAGSRSTRDFWRIAALLLCLFGVVLPALAQTTVIRVNTGGGAYTDSNGNVWSADTGYNTGGTASDSGSVAGTNDPALYLTSRWDDSPAPELQYNFTVPNGGYEVRLHFADVTVPAWPVGGRVFDVKIEGATVLSHFDITAEVGHAVALIKTFNVQVTDGQINIEFLHGPANHPLINALEILSSDKPTTPLGLTATVASGTQVNLAWAASSDDGSVAGYSVERCQSVGCTTFTEIARPAATSYSDSGLSGGTTYRYRVRAVDNDGNFSSAALATVSILPNSAFTPIRVNSGGPAYTDSIGNTWAADTGFNTGFVANESGTVSGTSDPTLYMTSRWDDSPAPELEYSFNVPIGWYQVNLLFANMYNYNVGRRVFSVQLEGNTVFANLDLTAEVGNYTATTKSSVVKVTDGQLNIRFFHTAADHPLISALSVLQQSGYDLQAPAMPPALSAVAAQTPRIDLAWSAATDNVAVTGYRIERCRGAGCTSFAEIASVTGTAFADTTVSSSTTYRYRVRATDAASNFSLWSSIGTATTLSATDTQPPTAPTGLAVVNVSHTSVALSWLASADDFGVAGYRVERCEGTGCINFAEIASPAAPAFSDSGLSPGVLYRYRARAVDAIPNLSAYSSIASVTTLAGASDTEPPTVPGSPAGTAYSANRVALTWTASTDNVGVTGYFIERCSGSSCTNFTQLAALPAVTGYPDTGLAGGTVYRYRIRAADADQNFSAYSSVVTVSSAAGDGTAGSTAYQYDSQGRLGQVTVVPQ